jgi:hypothetical protein
MEVEHLVLQNAGQDSSIGQGCVFHPSLFILLTPYRPFFLSLKAFPSESVVLGPNPDPVEPLSVLARRPP